VYKNRIISKDASVLEALYKMDSLDRKLLIVLDGEKFHGLISIGDIQRAIIANKPLSVHVSDVIRQNIRISKPEDSFDDIRQMMIDFRMELCPVVNNENEIIDVFFWEDLFTEKQQPADLFDLPVVIMAGGKGTRLKPLTNVLPKPLIPISEKTMLEEIFDRFSFHGCNRFFISTNYKSEFIEYYLNSLKLPYEIKIFREDRPLGTAGSLSLLKGLLQTTFFVTNCDILIEQDYSEILKFHKENNNDITIVAAIKIYPIPYGTIESGNGGKLISLAEKPEITFKINSGMYVLEPSVLDYILPDQVVDITQVIEKINNLNGRIGVFPVNERSWKDIGDSFLLRKYFDK